MISPLWCTCSKETRYTRLKPVTYFLIDGLFALILSTVQRTFSRLFSSSGDHRLSVAREDV